MRGRKNGCPVNIRNWVVSILDKTSDDYVRIYGLTSLTRSIDSTSEDGSAQTDLWEEPYITKRSGSVKLEGKEVIVESTGESDAGQELLNFYAEQAYCDGDCTLKFVDPYGHAWIADYVVTGRELSADDSETTVSWDLEQVGEAEILPYVTVSGVSLKDGQSAVTTLAMETGDAAKVITIVFTPDGASNKRFKITNNNRNVVAISNITENSFSVTPIAVGSATVTVTTVNATKTASLSITVSAGD